MARGKIQIKKIENLTNRQVTYSKRRAGLFKKAHELTVLCDARVSIILVSSTNKLHEYISPSTSTKQMIDQYQNVQGGDIWSKHYENMQAQLKNLKEVNRGLRRQIRQRVGQSLNDLSYDQLGFLVDEIDNSLKNIRERKYKVLTNQIETAKKKVRNGEEVNRNLLLEFDARFEDPHYGLVENEGDYNSVYGFANGAHRILALRLHQPILHVDGGGNHLRDGGGSNIHSAAGSDLTFALLE